MPQSIPSIKQKDTLRNKQQHKRKKLACISKVVQGPTNSHPHDNQYHLRKTRREIYTKQNQEHYTHISKPRDPCTKAGQHHDNALI